MQTFLKQVAEHYSRSEDCSRTLFIFPNRRSLAFFRKHLCDAAAKEDRVRLLPVLTTVSDFYTSLSGLREADSITLLTMLHKAWREVNPKAEGLDDFVWWGGVILSDFGDIDRYEVDARGLFANISDINAIKYDYSFLEKEQIEALELLGKHCINGNPGEGRDAAREFLGIWPLLHPLYEHFNKALDDAGLAYQGKIYRRVAGFARNGSLPDVLKELYPETSKYVFVGLNALSSCEDTVMGRMRDERIAEFCWDYGSQLLDDPRNVAGANIRKNIARFKPAFTPEKPEGTPVINIVNVPSASGQARLLPQIMENVADRDLGIDYAVVLPDESLLPTVLGSIPDKVEKVNVTMGCPLRNSEWATLMREVMALQFHLRQNKADGSWSFYHRQVRDILTSGLLHGLLSKEEISSVEEILARKEIYVREDSFAGTGLPEHYFKAVLTTGSMDSRLADYLLELINATAARMGEEDKIHKEFAMKYWRCVNRLREISDQVQPRTWARLLDRLTGMESLPFEGEPLGGLQIMGPLETRGLDFKHIVILSAGEGIFPGRTDKVSFIPGSLKIPFGLPTREDQDAVWAYYFYRLIGRASQVWMLYDSRSDGLNTGEESRFIKQLSYHFNLPVRHRFVAAEAQPGAGAEPGIPKTSEDIKAIRRLTLSASSLKSYLDCPAQFYYARVAGLKEEDEVSEDLDAGMIGNVYHATMQALYLGPEAMDPAFPVHDKDAVAAMKHRLREVDAAYLRTWLSRRAGIKARVRSLILSELRTVEVRGSDLVTENVIVQYVVKTLERDLERLERSGMPSFRILGLERCFTMEMDGFRFIGFVDRMDSFLPGEVRIVDYKTGKVTDDDINITSDTAAGIAEKLFGTDNQNRPKIAFQVFLYDKMAAGDPAVKDARLVNTIYQPSRLFVKPVEDVPADPTFISLVEERLHGLLAELENPQVGFRRTDDEKTCSMCAFKKICGR